MVLQTDKIYKVQLIYFYIIIKNVQRQEIHFQNLTTNLGLLAEQFILEEELEGLCNGTNRVDPKIWL